MTAHNTIAAGHVRAWSRTVTAIGASALIAGAVFAAGPNPGGPPAVSGVDVTLTAEALIVGGTGIQNPAEIDGYMSNAVNYYLRPTTASCALICIPQPVPYIAQWWPFPMEGWGGLKGAKFDVSVASGVAQLTSDLVGADNPGPLNPIAIAGFSQGTTVASQVKADLSKLSAQDQANISFNLLANLTRPNGGVLERWAFLGTVPIWDVTFGGATLTNTKMATTDIAFQYDGTSDFPQYPLNLLAVLNAFAGMVFIHPTLMSPTERTPGLPGGLTPAELSAALADPANRQQYGDTTYITIPTANLPLLQPIRSLGELTKLTWLTTPLTDLVEPVLRLIIENGYNRSAPYGQPTPVGFFNPTNPFTFTVDFVNAIGEGVRAALNDIGVSLPAQAVSKPAAVAPAQTVSAPAAAVSAPAVQIPAAPASIAPEPAATAPAVHIPAAPALPAAAAPAGDAGLPAVALADSALPEPDIAVPADAAPQSGTGRSVAGSGEPSGRGRGPSAGDSGTDRAESHRGAAHRG